MRYRRFCINAPMFQRAVERRIAGTLALPLRSAPIAMTPTRHRSPVS